ncbi:hypothetical protein CDAR_367741 [Caerostris darwini]|uniref:Uncharacterized protein n=1 Tax=Caerostris darwini TaxID=1538125 RepID=A0AAV4WVE8_9ARAC|nr:hypothetical protein CDAR_367741 [Caerostris darwini]
MISEKQAPISSLYETKIPHGCTEFPQFDVISKIPPQHFDKNDDLSFCTGFRSFKRAPSQKRKQPAEHEQRSSLMLQIELNNRFCYIMSFDVHPLFLLSENTISPFLNEA